LNLLTLII